MQMARLGWRQATAEEEGECTQRVSEMRRLREESQRVHSMRVGEAELLHARQVRQQRGHMRRQLTQMTQAEVSQLNAAAQCSGEASEVDCIRTLQTEAAQLSQTAEEGCIRQYEPEVELR